MGLHTYLAINEVDYESQEAVEFAGTYFLLLNYWTLVESNRIAKERGETFYGFEKSTYGTGSYFEKYINNDWSPKLPRVKELFQDIFIPIKSDWDKLSRDVAEHGIYHGYRLAVAPTGSISYVNETSASLQPILQRIEERQEKKTGSTYYPAPYLSDKTIPYYKSAYDMDMRWMIDIYAAAQEHVDQGMSMTLFLKEDIDEGMYPWKDKEPKQTTRDLNILRNYAWHKGIKSIYYIRTYRENDQEIGSNSCESCSI